MKKIFVAAISFFMLISLCGCTKSVTKEETATASTASKKQEAVVSASGSPQSDLEETILSRSKINKTLSSGVVIDANVTGLNKESLATYTGTPRIFSVDEVTEALGISLEDALTSQTSYSLDSLIPGNYSYFKFKDTKELMCNTNQFLYTSDTFLAMRELLIVDGSADNTDLFLTGSNLDFATIEQAKSEIHTVLDKLGIPVVNEPLCYTMDFKNISAENERQYAIALEEAKDFDQESFAPKKFTITEDDASYLFYYPIAVDGLPISKRMNGVYSDGSLMRGTELVVCYSKDGIMGFTLEYQMDVLEKTETKPVISLDEILSTVESKYDSLILDGEYLIYDIKLEYIAKPIFEKEATYELIPVWCFAIEHNFELNSDADKGGESGYSHHETDFNYNMFNAITGEELPINLGGS